LAEQHSLFPNQAAEFVALTHYCRWREEDGRRETWDEVVERVVSFLRNNTPGREGVPPRVWERIRDGLATFSVMPSMRLVATAGPVVLKDNACIYNCAYFPIRDLRSFSELMFLLMCGSGVGFSVEREFVQQLPPVAQPGVDCRDDYAIEDSREGWAKAFLFALETWFAGESVRFDFSQIRPYGARLKQMGGRASGAESLQHLFADVEAIVRRAAGRRLTPLECHDICCMVAEKIVMGGKRRSAMISFSDLDDEEMRHAKDFSRGPVPSYRFIANNSVAYTKKPDPIVFMNEWAAMAASGSGERGILNTSAVPVACSQTRKYRGDERTNPCGEIILRPHQFCNLSEVVLRPADDIGTLVDKVKTAAWLGVIQGTFTFFPFLRKEWAENCNEERLAGVSLTGQMDHPSLLTEKVLEQLKTVVERTVEEAARCLGVPAATAYTCVKPSGTVSQLVDSASGLHPRWSRYYLRRYRIAANDPVLAMLRAQGLPWEPETGQTRDNFTTAVVTFPVQAPATAVFRDGMDAFKQLDWYRKVQQHWCTHNASCTVYVKPDEWLKVANYVYEHWEEIVGVTFYPYTDAEYELAPFEEIDEATYRDRAAKFPKLDFSQLGKFEAMTGDTTTVDVEPACFAGRCEIL